MDLVTVRELYRNREEYLDKEVTIGGWLLRITRCASKMQQPC